MKISIYVFVAFLLSFSLFAFNDYQLKDARDSRVARIRASLTDSGFCTAFTVGNNCMVSAGHCVHRMNYVEFNPGLTDIDGRLKRSSRKDTYRVDRRTPFLKYQYSKVSDWAVFRVTGNPERRMGYFKLYKERYLTGLELLIIGYYSDNNFVQSDFGRKKASWGYITQDSGNKVRYKIQSTPGMSGSPLIVDDPYGDARFIGVHGSAYKGWELREGELVMGN